MGDEKHEGLPVAGYKPQTFAAVDEVNANKQLEERVLRRLDELARMTKNQPDFMDGDWAWIARQKLQEGFMALNRAIFQPGRVALPEDNPIGTKQEASS